MLKRTRTALVAGGAIVALAGIGGGVAVAADGGSASPTAATVLAASTTGTNTAPTTTRHRAHPLLDRVEHGQVTLRTRTGTEVVDVQRGMVTAVTGTSVTVRSQDGFTASYAVASTSKIRKGKAASSISEVAVGDRVAVVADHTGATDPVKRLADAGPAPAKPSTTTPATPTH